MATVKKSIKMPQEVIDAVQSYADAEDQQSWSAAAIELIVAGYEMKTGHKLAAQPAWGGKRPGSGRKPTPSE